MGWGGSGDLWDLSSGGRPASRGRPGFHPPPRAASRPLEFPVQLSWTLSRTLREWEDNGHAGPPGSSCRSSPVTGPPGVSYHPVGDGGSHEGTNISSATFNRHGVPCRRASAIEKYKRVQWNPFVFLAEAAIMSSAPDSSNMDVVRCDHNHALQGAGVTRHLRPGNIKNMPGGSFCGPCRPCPFQGLACID